VRSPVGSPPGAADAKARQPGCVRAVWTGTISFGLVVLPVQLYAATEERRVTLREIHAADGARVQHRRWCTAEDKEIPYAEVGRGYDLGDGRTLPLSDSELANMPLPTRRVIDVLGFVEGTSIDPISYGRAYYAGPHGPAADRPYALLTEAMARTGRVVVARLAIRSRERLAAIRPMRGVLIVQTLLWADEVREPGDLAPSAPVTERELELAEVLIAQLTGVEITNIHDEYRHALEALVEAKLAGTHVEAPREPPPAADLMTALEASVRQAREERGE
jgi:DNA end-binding protein Ku